MSCLVTRPPMPDPAIWPMSTPCSFAIRRTSGEDFWWPAAGADGSAGADGCRGGATGAVGAEGAAARCRGCRRGAAAGAHRVPSHGGIGGRRHLATSPATPIVATTLLTGTVSPSLTAIDVSTPAAGDGISASTLSVEISKSGSSRSTESPTFLIQRTIVPSAIDSPICGITTGVDIDFSVQQFKVRNNLQALKPQGPKPQALKLQI